MWKGHRIIALVLFCLPQITVADTEGIVGFGTNYIWRGETRTDDGPAVFASLDYQPTSRFHAGVRTFNIEENSSREYEVDTWLGYRFPIRRVRAEVGLINYQFPRGDRIDRETGKLVEGTGNHQDFTEFYTTVAVSRITLGYYRTNDYFGSSEIAHYGHIDYRQAVNDSLVFGLHYGLKKSDAVPDHEGTVYDLGASVGIDAFRIELTNLDDNEDGLQSDNPRLSVYWRHCFSL